MKNNQFNIISLTLLLTFSLSSTAGMSTKTSNVEPEASLVPVKTVAPGYPRKAAVEKITGEVKLSFVVTVEGKVKDVKVIDSKPGKIFNREAVKAMKKWTFEPLEVETRGTQTLTFALE